MTSFRQAEANRHNALKSTGPKTENGKRRSRRNAVRHGLCAETVIEILEDIEDYRAFEAAVIADYEARTAVERELVLRLASLLWRMRRATSIETDLLRIQAEILLDRAPAREPIAQSGGRSTSALEPDLQATIRPALRTCVMNGSADESNQATDTPRSYSNPEWDDSARGSRELTHCFLRLANFDNSVFERLGRYEASLWRQVVQMLFVLNPIRRR